MFYVTGPFITGTACHVRVQDDLAVSHGTVPYGRGRAVEPQAGFPQGRGHMQGPGITGDKDITGIDTGHQLMQPGLRPCSESKSNLDP